MQKLIRLADELDAVACTLSRMPLASHKAPEAPHEARAEICRAMFSIGDRLRKGVKELAETQPERPRSRRAVPSAKGIHGVYVNNGDGTSRYVPVTKR